MSEVKPIPELKRAIGLRVRSLRGKKSLSQVGEAAGVNRQIVAAIEQGRTDYRIKTLLKVLLALSDDDKAIPTRFTFPLRIVSTQKRKSA